MVVLPFPMLSRSTWRICAAGTSREPCRLRQCFYRVSSTKATATLVGRQRLLANHRPTVVDLETFLGQSWCWEREEGLKCSTFKSTGIESANQSCLEDHLCLDIKPARFWLPVPFPPERCSQSPHAIAAKIALHGDNELSLNFTRTKTFWKIWGHPGVDWIQTLFIL